MISLHNVLEPLLTQPIQEVNRIAIAGAPIGQFSSNLVSPMDPQAVA